MKWSENTLNMLGLSVTEQCILECLSTAKSVQEIAKESRISRTGINYCLKNLYKKDLVSSTKQGKRKVYIAVTFKELARKLGQTVDAINIENKDKIGLRIRTSLENEFVIHVGLKEIIPAYERIASMHKNERISGIQHHRSYDELTRKLSPKLLIRFNQTAVKNNLILEGILNEGAYAGYYKEIKKDPTFYAEAVKSLGGRMADYNAFQDNFFNYDSEIWFFRTTTMIINWHEEVAIEMTNQNMTGFLKDMFQFVKMGTKKIDHNKMLQDILERVKSEQTPIA